MEILMMDFGKMIKEKEKENKYIQMEIFIMEIGKIIQEKEKEK